MDGGGRFLFTVAPEEEESEWGSDPSVGVLGVEGPFGLELPDGEAPITPDSEQGGPGVAPSAEGHGLTVSSQKEGGLSYRDIRVLPVGVSVGGGVIVYELLSNSLNEVYIKSGSQSTKVDLFDYLKKIKLLNPGEIILTSINHDGTMKGYDIETFIKAKEILNIPIIASGGCGNYQHMADLLEKCSISALSAASMYHFTEQTPLGAKKFLKRKGFKVRL